MDISERMPAPPMRASDADRDRVLALLSEAFQAGRLTSEELEERTGRALTARTLEDLDDLTVDLPVPRSTEPGPMVATPARRPVRAPYIAVAALVVIVAGIVAGAGNSSHDWRFLWALIVIPLIVRRIAVGRTGTGRR